MRVELFNDDVSAVADSGSARFMNMNSDMEKMAAIPFLESAPTGGAAGGSISGIAQARARQFQPQKPILGATEEDGVTSGISIPKNKLGDGDWTHAGLGIGGSGFPWRFLPETNEIFWWEGSGALPEGVKQSAEAWLEKKGFENIKHRYLYTEPWRGASTRRNEDAVKESHGGSSASFQPRAEETQQEFGGFPAGAKPFLTTTQLATMSRKELMDHFPEAIVPKRSADTVPSKLREAPLVKDADNPVQTYADKLAEFGRSVENTPEYQMGRKWYSEFSEQLKARFGDDARVFAELLAATSPQTSVESNFKFALDALEGFKSGRFKQNIKKFEQGLQLIANEKWLSWYNRELNAGRIENPPAKPTPAAFMARWIEAHDIKPRQSNGKLFGINSIPVLQVAARRWLEQNKGPKVKNFVENLLGEGTEATIDLWADRTLRRLGYADFQDRWRIMPVNKQGVSDEDFAFAQSIFRNAAEQLGMKPSELQAAVWFAEKQLWADNGWSRLDLGDFREQLKKTDALRAEIRGRENPPAATPDLLSVQPRDIVR